MAKMGRPLVEIDLETVEKLGQLQCTIKEISAFMNIPEGTLKTRPDFSTAHKKGQEVGKMSLRRLQYKLAEKSAGMAIWLGKQYLDQRDSALVDNSQHTHYTTVIQKLHDLASNNGKHKEDDNGNTNRLIPDSSGFLVD